MQRRGEAPGAAALAADEQDRLGAIRAAGCPGCAAARAARRARSARPFRPSRARRAPSAPAPARASRRPGRCAACRWFPRRAPTRQVGPAQERAGALVEIPGAPVGLQREDVGRVAGIGKAQLAQLRDRRVAEQRPSRSSATPVSPLTSAGKAGVAPPSGSRSKVEAVIHSAVADDRTRPSDGDPGDLDMQPPGKRPAQAARTSAASRPRAARPAPRRRATGPASPPPPRPWRCGPPSPEEQRPVQVGQPAFGRVRVGRGHALARGRVDHGGAGRAAVEPVGGDPARGRAADLLDARIGGLDALGERGDASGPPRPAARQARSAAGKTDSAAPLSAEDGDESQGQQTRPAMECADHGPAPHMS